METVGGREAGCHDERASEPDGARDREATRSICVETARWSSHEGGSTGKDVHIQTAKASASSDEGDEETPALFMSSMPSSGPTPALQALSALIDEADDPIGTSGGRKRKAASLGTVQVHLALMGGAHTDGAEGPPRRVRAATVSEAMQRRGGCMDT
ncbi:hypothetical protein AB1Y20_012065 [Prymnesium parvum]|uniref:Uncharacterized protein n=1 Tax=Prymnesium parvum TaxID=97485 RepID=A0AB34INF2_PRYPA